MRQSDWLTGIREFFWNDPLTASAVTVAMIALATTPIAFAVLGRTKWFDARRGRVMRRPEFASVVALMALVMGIPAIFTALVVKSHSFDKNRYEFDPNKTWSVLEQGRSYKSLEEADKAIKAEMARLAEERKNLVDNVKKLDEAMLALRAVAGTSPSVAQTIPRVLERLAGVRKSVGVDAPQQLQDFTAPPAEIASAARPSGANVVTAAVPAAVAAPVAAPSGVGLPKAVVDAEIAAVAEPQKKIAAMLPLTDLPEGWEVAKSGDKHLETFNAENLFEKIDGRAESFVDYKVKGMAYASFHPVGDDSSDVQVYIFELGDTLKALGKYGTEKPDDFKPIAVGAEGYTAAGSTLFYSGPYYTQIVSTKDDARFSAFALTLARRIADAQKPGGAPVSVAEGSGTPRPKSEPADTLPKPAPTAAVVAPAAGTPEAIFALLPAGPGRVGQTYVPNDVFGYSFLSDVFLADYSEGAASWKGFLRAYASPEEARAVFEKYLASAKQDGAEFKEDKAEGADRMVIASNIGLYDTVFLKGNTLAGAAGSTEAKPAENFARAFAKALPDKVQAVAVGK